MTAKTDKTRQRVATGGAEVATTDAPAAPSLTSMIERMKPEIAKAIPKHMTADRMARVATTLVRQNPALLRATPESFLGALMTCAQLGLEPGPLGHVYLTGPFRNRNTGKQEIVLIVGYKGLIDLAMRSGQVESIIAREVYANDEFMFEYGLADRLVHRPVLNAERGDIVAVYAIARISGATDPMFLVLDKGDVDKFRGRAKASDNGPWVTDYEAMAKKTAVRRLSTFLPMSIEFATAIAQDDAVRTVENAGDLELPVAPAEDVVDAEVVESTTAGTGDAVNEQTGEVTPGDQPLPVIDEDVDPDNDADV